MLTPRNGKWSGEHRDPLSVPR